MFGSAVGNGVNPMKRFEIVHKHTQTFVLLLSWGHLIDMIHSLAPNLNHHNYTPNLKLYPKLNLL